MVPHEGEAESGRVFGRFRRDAKGSTAIEFGMLIRRSALRFRPSFAAILESRIRLWKTDACERRRRCGAPVPHRRKPVTAAEKQPWYEKIFTLVCGRMSVIVTENCPGLKIVTSVTDNFTDARETRLRHRRQAAVLTDDGKTTPRASSSIRFDHVAQHAAPLLRMADHHRLHEQIHGTAGITRRILPP